MVKTKEIVKKREDYANLYKGVMKKIDWLSQYHQIELILETKTKDYVEIGCGAHILTDFFKRRGFKVTTVDINKTFEPDIVGDVTKLPLPDNYTNVSCAFQVLEHMPYEKSLKGLAELHRISKKWVLISVPLQALLFTLRFNSSIMPYLPVLKKLNNADFLKHFQKKKTFKKAGQHYWELGYKDFEIKKVKADFENIGFEVVDHYLLKDNPSHYFFKMKVVK